MILENSASARTARANQRLNLAHVGVGVGGRQLMVGFTRMENTAALCDVNRDRAAQMFAKFPDVPKFQDFREMLHEMGDQGTGSGPSRRALELIRGGWLGEIREVHMWNDQGGPGWETPPEGEAEIPAHLNWDLWLGPARGRPFHPRWMTWHGWRDFGTGNLGNWASHTLNLAFLALAVDSLWYADPAARSILRVEAEAAAVNRLSFPRWELVRWDVPARGEVQGRATEHARDGRGVPGARARLVAGLPRRPGRLGEFRLLGAPHRVQHAGQRGHAVCRRPRL
jgi:hypothetical protein